MESYCHHAQTGKGGMMKQSRWAILWTMVLLGAAGCQSETNQDDATDPTEQNIVDSGSDDADSLTSQGTLSPHANGTDDSEVVTDLGATGNGSDTETVDEENRDIDTQSTNETSQKIRPLTFTLLNQTDDSVALSTKVGLTEILNCTDADGVSYAPANPYCIPACDTVSPDDDCQRHCDTTSNAVKIGSHQALEVSWDGYFRTIEHDYCADGGDCYIRHPATPGDYEFSIKVHPHLSCVLMSGSCYWTDNHFYSGGMATGSETVFSTSVSLPSSENVEMTIDQLQ